jgi:DNA-binding XRE family transcriptional regulator
MPRGTRKAGKPDPAGEMVRDYKIAIKACAGETVTQIARELDCNRKTVYYALEKDRVKEYVEKHTLKMLENLPQAVQNVTGLVNKMEGEVDKDERKLCYQATRDVLSVGNVLPSQNQTTLIQNVYNQQNNLIMSPIIKGMIDQHNKLMSFESVDAEVVNGPEEVREAQEG